MCYSGNVCIWLLFCVCASAVHDFFFTHSLFLLSRLCLSVCVDSREASLSIHNKIFVLRWLYVSLTSMRPHTVKIHSKLKCLCCAGPKLYYFNNSKIVCSLTLSLASALLDYRHKNNVMTVPFFSPLLVTSLKEKKTWI